MTLRLWPKSLVGQLLGLMLIALVVSQAVTIALLMQGRRSAVEAATREQVLGRVAALVRLIEDTPRSLHPQILETAGSARLVYSIEPTPIAQGQNALRQDLDDLIVEVFGPGREVRVDLAERNWPRRDRRDIDDDETGEPRERRAPRLMTVAFSIKLGDGNWLNGQTILPAVPFIAWQALLSPLVTGTLMILVAGLMLRRITRPLRELGQAADRLGRGETVPDLPESGPREVVHTAHAFNLMQARVRRFVADRTRMLAAMSHDLRTPLTALRLRAEFIDDDEIREKIVGTVDEMSRMAEATLAFARDDAKTEEARPTDLVALVRAVADDFSDLGEDVTVDSPEKLEARVRPVALRRAVRNLVENAIRYGGRADVGLARAGDGFEIRVADSGPGIPDDKLEEVFEPFTRLETSRSQETGGVGLGLSTARSIIRAHGGELVLRNRPEGGLEATIRLP